MPGPFSVSSPIPRALTTLARCRFQSNLTPPWRNHPRPLATLNFRAHHRGLQPAHIASRCSPLLVPAVPSHPKENPP